MTQTTCDCVCMEPSISVPVTGLDLKLAASAFTGIGVDYSTEEQWSGHKWLDGKKIYQKTVIAPNRVGSADSFPHGIPNVDKVIDFKAVGLKDGTAAEHYSLTLPHIGNTTDLLFGITANRTSYFFRNYGALWNDFTIYITLFYTCLDR